MSLEILGGTVVDVIFPQVGHLPTWPRHTEFTSTNLALLDTPPLVTLGGNGANAAFVAARCGADVTLHTCIGDDALGILARRWLNDAGCAISSTQRHGATAVNVTAANSRHERATFFYPGDPIPLPKFSKIKPTTKVFLVCGWPHPPLDKTAALFARLRAKDVFTSFDVGPLLNQRWTLPDFDELFLNLSLLIANAHEAGQITQQGASIPAAIRSIRQHFAGHIVIKNGAKGAWWVPAGEAKGRHFPAKHVRAINTVGAGDSFNGALITALANGSAFPAALRYAAKTAASVVASARGVLGVKPTSTSTKKSG